MWIILSIVLIGLKYFNVIDWTWSSVWLLASAPIWIPWILALTIGAHAVKRTTRTTRRAPVKSRRR